MHVHEERWSALMSSCRSDLARQGHGAASQDDGEENHLVCCHGVGWDCLYVKFFWNIRQHRDILLRRVMKSKNDGVALLLPTKKSKVSHSSTFGVGRKSRQTAVAVAQPQELWNCCWALVQVGFRYGSRTSLPLHKSDVTLRHDPRTQGCMGVGAPRSPFLISCCFWLLGLESLC